MMLLSVFAAVLLFQDSFPQQHPNREIHQLLQKGIQALMRQEYGSARDTFRELRKKHAANPLGNIFLAATEITYANDYALDFHNERVLELLNEAVALSEKLLDKEPKNLWYNYYKGLAEGYKAAYHGMNENWFSALSTGFESKQFYEVCLELDPGFSEASIAVGTWKFWSSEKMEFLNWLPFVRDEREAGIRLLEMSMKRKTYHLFTAAHTLAWIYIPQKRFAEAKAAIDFALKQFPESRLLLWDLARINTELDRGEAINNYLRLLSSYAKDTKKNRANDINIRFLLSKLYLSENQRQKAAEMLRAIPHSSLLTDVEEKRLGSKLARVVELKKSLGIETEDK